MPGQKKKRRKPVLLISVASVAAVFILYLEFFADPIIDPPEFFSDGELQVQYLKARSPFSRRVISRLVTVDRPWSLWFGFQGGDVRGLPAGDGEGQVGSPETLDLLWDQRGYVNHLRETSMRDGLNPFLNQVAEETGDLHLARMTWTRFYKMD
jgi:hypothetical protein